MCWVGNTVLCWLIDCRLVAACGSGFSLSLWSPLVGLFSYLLIACSKHSDVYVWKSNDNTIQWIIWLGGRWRTELTPRCRVNCRTHEHRHFERILQKQAHLVSIPDSGSVKHLSSFCLHWIAAILCTVLSYADWVVQTQLLGSCVLGCNLCQFSMCSPASGWVTHQIHLATWV